MKISLVGTVIVLALLASVTGCCAHGNLTHKFHKGGANAGHFGTPIQPDPPFAGPAGPPVASYAYPYYTVRAPRDFLVDNPPSIGR